MRRPPCVLTMGAVPGHPLQSTRHHSTNGGDTYNCSRQQRLASANGSSGGMRRKQQARTAATVHISFWIDGPPGLPLKQTATFRCEEDALRFLQQRKYTGRQHREPRQMSARRMSASTPEPPTPGQYSSDLAVGTPARSAARAAAAALAAVAAPPVYETSFGNGGGRCDGGRGGVGDCGNASRMRLPRTRLTRRKRSWRGPLLRRPRLLHLLGEEASEGAAAAATPAADSERKAPEGATTAATPAAGLVAATVATAVPLALSRLAAASAAVGCDPQAGAFVLSLDCLHLLFTSNPRFRARRASHWARHAARQAARTCSGTSGLRYGPDRAEDAGLA